MTVRVAYTNADRGAYHRVLECHKSQYTTEESEQIEKALGAGWNGSVWFRPWFGDQKSQDLFK